ncbi:MAG: autotransporter-associated beta strand repeat-containing protein, partial [Verrucomicrobia bacterium]|nr:autotransporter-associated beta strand repeat-containing protein [Verrucomicrobiota bacterium]
MKMKNLNPILEHRTLNQNPRRKCALAVPAWLALLLAAGTLQAGTLWWDGGTTDIGANGDGLSAGGGGTWNTTIMNWDQGAGQPHLAWDNATNDTAVFGGSGGTITLETDITLGGLQFEGTSSTRVSGGTLNFGPGGAITNLNSSNVEEVITSAITGNPSVGIIAFGPPYDASRGGLRFAPASGSMALGTVTLALNTGIGGLWDKTILWLSGSTTGNTLGDVRPTPANGGYYSQMICDSGEWTVTGTAQPWTANIRGGTLKVTGTLNPYAGAYVSSGTLHYNSPAGVNGGLDFNGGNLDQTSGAAITTSTSNPSMQWNADFTFLGSNGANSDLNLGTGAVLLTGNRTVTVSNAAATLTVGGAISDNSVGYGLTKDGTGTLELAGFNTYGSGTTIIAGTLQADTPDALAAGALIISSPGVAKLNYIGDHVVSALVIGGTAKPAGTYGSSSSPATPPDDIHFAGTGTVTVMETTSVGRTLWWDGGTTDPGVNGDGLSAGGDGTWNTTITNWDQGAGLPHVAWNNTTNDTAVFGGIGGTVTLETDITLGGLEFKGTSATTVSCGTLNFGSGGAITNLNSSDAVQIITSAITGEPAVGVCAEAGPPWHAYVGGLRFAPSSGSVALGTVTLALNAGQPGFWDKTVLWLGGSTTGNTLGDVRAAPNDGKYSQMICDSGEWTVTGTAQPWTANIRGGTLKVTGTLNPYAGANVSSGTLHYNSPGGVNGGLDFNGGNLDQTSGAPITTSTYNPSMQWNANFTFLGSNGANSDLNLGTGSVLLTGSCTVTINNDATLTVGGAISGGANGYGLTKGGTGTLALAGTNTYGGDTTVLAGTLAVSGNSIANTNKLVIDGGKVDVAAAANEVVDTLYFGTNQQPAGT